MSYIHSNNTKKKALPIPHITDNIKNVNSQYFIIFCFHSFPASVARHAQAAEGTLSAYVYISLFSPPICYQIYNAERDLKFGPASLTFYSPVEDLTKRMDIQEVGNQATPISEQYSNHV